LTLRRPAIALAAVAAALAVLHLVLVLPVHGFLLSDTTGYLANARWLAGEAGDTWQGPTSFYHPLWSLLVAPIHLVTETPRQVQVGALLLNGVLSIAVLPAAYAVGRRVFGLAPWPAVAAGAVAATYPAVVLLAGYEWAEALYQLLFLGFVLAVAAPRSYVLVGALAAALNATHPRGIGIVGVAGLYLLVAARRDRRALAGLATLAVLFVATRLLNGALLDAIYGDTSKGVEGDVLSRLTEPRLVWGAVKAAIGQAWYLTVASFGLVPLGALWLAITPRVSRTVRLVVLGAGVATLAASALQMSDGTRVDHMVYGRYDEGAVPAFLVAGAAAVVAWRAALPRLLGAVAAVVAVLAAVLVAVRGGEVFRGDVMPLNVTGILVWRDDVSEVDVLRVTVLAVVVTAAVLLAGRWRPVAGLAVAALVFAGSSASVQARTIDPFDDTFAGMTRISETLRSLPRGSIGYDRAGYEHEAANFYQLELADLGVRFVDSRRAEPAADYVIGRPRASYEGARLVFAEKGMYRQALWVLPGPLQDRLVRAGDVLEDGALPEAARRQRIRAEFAPIEHGTTRRITVSVTHTGEGAGWVPLDAIPGREKGVVRLGARWFRGDEEVLGMLAELDRVLLPGQSTRVPIDVGAPSPPGRYTLRLGLLEEGVGWFPGGLELTVDVR